MMTHPLENHKQNFQVYHQLMPNQTFNTLHFPFSSFFFLQFHTIQCIPSLYNKFHSFQMHSSLNLSPLLPSPKLSTQSTHTSRSLSLKRRFIAVITPALQQQNYIRSIQELTKTHSHTSPRSNILPLQDIIAKTAPQRHQRPTQKMNKQGHGGCHRGQKMVSLVLENQEALQFQAASRYAKQAWLSSSPSSPINRLLVDSYIRESLN